GLCLAWLFYRGRSRWVGHEAALLATLLFVLVDPVKHYCTSARGYVFLMLGAVVLADLLLAYIARGRALLLAAYAAAAVATCYALLWIFPVMAAHGVFLVIEASRPGTDPLPRARLVAAMAAIVAAVALGLLVYAPMIRQFVAMGSQHVSGVMTS